MCASTVLPPLLGSTRKLGRTQEGTHHPPPLCTDEHPQPASELLSYTHMRHWWVKLHVAFMSHLCSSPWFHRRDQQHLELWQKHMEHCVVF